MASVPSRSGALLSPTAPLPSSRGSPWCFVMNPPRYQITSKKTEPRESIRHEQGPPGAGAGRGVSKPIIFVFRSSVPHPGPGLKKDGGWGPHTEFSVCRHLLRPPLCPCPPVPKLCGRPASFPQVSTSSQQHGALLGTPSVPSRPRTQEASKPHIRRLA